MSNHTPGPWATSRECPKFIKPAPDILGESNVLIASVHGHPGSGFFPSEEEAIANARLISAAPELLDALQLIFSMYDDHLSVGELASALYEARCIAREPITKATGKCPTT